MQPQTNLIGILGGTYDPVHKGHVYIATALAKHQAFQNILVVPCYQPVHREPPRADAQNRLAMVELAFTNYPKIQVDVTEINRQGPSYAYDTLNDIKSRNPESPLCWILGTDAFASFHQWHKWQQILELGHLVLVKRPGTPLPSGGPEYDMLQNRQVDNLQRLTEQDAGLITVVDINPPAISAHNIRQKLSRGDSVVDLLPSKIWDYINRHRLYMDE